MNGYVVTVIAAAALSCMTGYELVVTNRVSWRTITPVASLLLVTIWFLLCEHWHQYALMAGVSLYIAVSVAFSLYLFPPVLEAWERRRDKKSDRQAIDETAKTTSLTLVVNNRR